MGNNRYTAEQYNAILVYKQIVCIACKQELKAILYFTSHCQLQITKRSLTYQSPVLIHDTLYQSFQSFIILISDCAKLFPVLIPDSRLFCENLSVRP